MPGRYEFLLPAIELVSAIYMNALRMMIYPLVFCSLVVGVKGIGSISMTGKIGAQTIAYFVGTTLLASLLGLFLPRLLGLGTGVSIELAESAVEAMRFSSLLDTVKNLIPANPVAAFADGDMLQVLVFAIIVGVACLAVGEKAAPFLKVAEAVNEISIRIISVVMYFTPLGVFCSIASVMCANGAGTLAALAGVVAVTVRLCWSWAAPTARSSPSRPTWASPPCPICSARSSRSATSRWASPRRT